MPRPLAMDVEFPGKSPTHVDGICPREIIDHSDNILNLIKKETGSVPNINIDYIVWLALYLMDDDIPQTGLPSVEGFIASISEDGRTVSYERYDKKCKIIIYEQ